ncbi:MAG: cytochrome c oxidase subunit II [Sphingomonadaceae bacterium]|nr:cytochrome c oxidase subunit II [Sphingomonadaceae bacterium]
MALTPLALGSVAASAATTARPVAAPATPAAPAATPVATSADAAAPAADAAAAAPAFEYARPVPGIGQPVVGGLDFQPQVTENGRFAHFLNNAILLPLSVVICLLVLGLLLFVVVRFRAGANPVPSKTSHNTLIEVIWTGIPILILVGVAVPSIDLLARQYAPPPANALTVKVTGYQWYWGYAYPDNGIDEYVSNMLDEQTAAARGEPYHLAADNRMVVPAGRTVKLIVTAADVIHSFAVPALWTKMDAVPGRLNEVTFRADRPGVYYGQCSELCGVNHGYMPIAVEVVTPERFAQWVASKGGHMVAPAPAAAAPAATPAAAPAATPAAAPTTPPSAGATPAAAAPAQ